MDSDQQVEIISPNQLRTCNEAGDDISTGSWVSTQLDDNISICTEDLVEVETLDEDIIQHAFLPKKISLKHQNDLEIENGMLNLAHSTLLELKLSQLGKVVETFQNWKQIQLFLQPNEEFVTKFQNQMKRLQIGDSTAIYIGKQNCTIVFTKLEVTMMRCMTFRSSLPNETVMGTVGSLQVKFPETDDVALNQDFLCSANFALQLHELSAKEFVMTLPKRKSGGYLVSDTRNVPEPYLVSDWIVGQLVPANHSTPNVTVTKKIRDEVRFLLPEPESELFPFRRSGMWTSIKIALALKIREIVKPEENANAIYKIVMLRLLTNLGLTYAQAPEVSFDLTSQILAKLGRRASKLQKLKVTYRGEDSNQLTKGIFFAKRDCLRNVLNVSTALNEKVTNLWNKISQGSNNPVSRIFRNKYEIKIDLHHQIPFLDELIDTRSASDFQQSSSSGNVPSIENIHFADLNRYTTFQASLQANVEQCKCANASKYSYELMIWLHDTELLIKTCLHSIENKIEALTKVFYSYISKALPFYKNQSDPVGYSQMVLCLLKLIQTLDKIATREHPLLLEYKSGINVQDFEVLLLPHVDDMNLMEEILNYFEGRDKSGKYPGILSNTQITEDTFSVRYATSNPNMEKLRTKIIEETEKHILVTYLEIAIAQKKCQELSKQISKEESCSCHWEKINGRLYKRKTCKYCDLTSSLNSERCSVRQYGRILPTEGHLQWCVTFELLIPSELASLRDALALLNFEILRTSSFNNRKSAGNWEVYLRSRGYPSTPASKIVKMGSNYRPAGIGCPDVLLESKEGFIIANNMDSAYFHDPSQVGIISGKGNSTVKDFCTFQIKNTSSPDKTPYENKTLQNALTTTTHTQNKIIAKTHSSHLDMSIAEFISFGSLRSGHRIQMRNLYRSIVNRSLSLEKEPVVALIMQSLWQLGPKDDKGVRESHAELLQNAHFNEEFLSVLSDVVDSNEKNYTSPFILLIVIVITTRIMELNSECHRDGYKLLLKCLQVIDNWAATIENQISQYELVQSSSENIIFLKSCLLKISICSSFTYKVLSSTSTTLLDVICRNPYDIIHLLQTISRMNNLISAGVDDKLSTFAKPFLMIARSVPFQLEKRILCSNVSSLSGCLHKFSTQKWSEAQDCILQGSWEKHPLHQNIFFASYIEMSCNSKKYVLTFDLHQGQFLVDGYPVELLPNEISSHSLYQLYFKGVQFKIQRDSHIFRTVDIFHGSRYEFFMIEKHLIIRGIDEGKNILELLHPSNFKNVINPSFIQKCTHWLDAKKKVVYFKRIPVEDSDYDLPPEFTLTLEGSNSKWILLDSSQKYLLSIKSRGFVQIAAALSRLEEKSNINVTFDKETGGVTALLPRYQLSFHLNDDGYLCSVEYPDYRISKVQVLGTLVGLQQGILMENVIITGGVTTTKKIILIPHGHIQVSPGPHHQTSEIKLSSLRSPKFFAYEVDPVLKRLVGGKSKSAWLYLAALHAATSSSLPDPSTGLTGTEMSMWILQSAMVWSGSPYDDESLRTLKIIRKFSPVRTFKSNQDIIEVTKWPEALPELAAFDGFKIAVNSLLQDSKQLAFLFPQEEENEREKKIKESEKEKEVKRKLLTRSYYRTIPFYNQDVSVKDDHISPSYQRPNYLVGGNFQLRRVNSCEQLILISQIRYLSKALLHPSILDHLESYDLTSYLIREEPLKAPQEIPNLHGLVYPLETLFETNLRYEWLTLYKYASSKERSFDNDEDIHAWSIFLSAMAYKEHPIEHIICLHLISQFAAVTDFPQVPDYVTFKEEEDIPNYSSPSAYNFSENEIKPILESSKLNFRARKLKCDGLLEDEDIKKYKLEQQKFINQQGSDIKSVISQIAVLWNIGRWNVEKQEISCNEEYVDYTQAIVQINQKLNIWYNNLKLKTFIQEVQALIRSDLYEKVRLKLEENQSTSQTLNDFRNLESASVPYYAKHDYPKRFQLEELLNSLPSGERLEMSVNTFESGMLPIRENISNLKELQGICKNEIGSFFTFIQAELSNSTEKQILLKTGMSPRVTPLFMAQLLGNEKIQRNFDLYNYIGALVVAFVHLRRVQRCILLESKGDAFATELSKEMKTLGHENWSPEEYPEWLLLELELDLMIRPVQVEVARQMMEMPNGGNGVMQLNMGEGKTSVIVPMLCSTLSNENTLCRVTVLNSIFKTNFNILTFAIGGLLSRRLCTVPCRRDMDLSIDNVNSIRNFYQQFFQLKGVIITLPEYRLSFRLKIFDNISKNKDDASDHGLELLKVENWLRSHVRDILDESDELLSVKYQLVYTIGTQRPIDGENMRWDICKDILQIVQNIASELDSTVIEFNKTQQEKNPEQFTHFRILKEECHHQLCDSVADQVLLEIPVLTQNRREKVKSFLMDENIAKGDHEEVMRSFQDDEVLLKKILVYSGYIRGGVLTLALTKRWRVEYGVDLNGRRRMAVPFRAKDVAAERTEFGHPDLAIILTHLSYYYSGLTDGQLMALNV